MSLTTRVFRKFPLRQSNIPNFTMKLLGENGLLKDVKINLRILNKYATLPFQLNETTNQLEMKSQRKLNILRIQLIIAALYLSIEFIQNYQVLKGSSLSVITQSILFFAVGVLIFSCQLVNYVKLPGIVQLWNDIIQLEQNFSKYFQTTKVEPKQNLVVSNLYLRCIIYLGTFTGATLTSLFAIDILRNPCFPAYPGYWLSIQCEDVKLGYYLEPTWSLVEVLVKVGIALDMSLIWGPLLSGCCFQILLQYVVEGHCFRVNTAELGK